MIYPDSSKNARPALFLIILIAILAGCTQPAPAEAEQPAAEPDAQTSDVEVLAGDGLASLMIPAGALPEGVDADSIAISSSSIDDLQAALGDNYSLMVSDENLLALYALAPDGLDFSQPASLTIELPIPEDGLFFEVLAISPDGVSESIKPDHTEVDFEKGTVTITAPVTHFSYIAFHAAWKMSTIMFEYPEFVYTAIPFTTELEIRTVPEIVFQGEEANDYVEGSKRVFLIREGEWTLDLDYTTKFLKPVSRNEKTAQVIELYDPDPLTWTCESGDPVKAEITLNGAIEFHTENVVEFPSPGQDDTSFDRKNVWHAGTFVKAVQIDCAETSPQDESTQPKEPEGKPRWDKPKKKDDPLDDNLCCIECINTSGGLPAFMDIIRAQVMPLDDWRKKGNCVYKFTIFTEEPFESGEGIISIALYDPERPQAGGHSLFCQPEGTNMMYYYMQRTVDGEMTSETLVEEMVANDDEAYSLIPTDREFIVEFEGNETHFYIPCDDIPKGATWMAWTVNTDKSKCDEVGR